MEKFLTGDAISIETTRKIAEYEHFSLWPSVKLPVLPKKKPRKWPNPLTVVAQGLNDTRLKELLSLPIEGLIDAQAMGDSIHDFMQNAMEDTLDYKLSFLLTCPVMYHCDVASVFVQALSKRLKLKDNTSFGIHMALHEAIVNGLIHGNLQIGSEYRQDARSFVEYGHILSKRLNDPSFARKSISISAHWDETKLELKVRDEGAGYVIKENFYNQTMTKVKNKTGRGLLFIAGIADSCTIDDYGREMTLTFGLKEDYTKMEQMNIF